MDFGAERQAMRDSASGKDTGFGGKSGAQTPLTPAGGSKGGFGDVGKGDFGKGDFGKNAPPQFGGPSKGSAQRSESAPPASKGTTSGGVKGDGARAANAYMDQMRAAKAAKKGGFKGPSWG